MYHHTHHHAQCTLNMPSLANFEFSVRCYVAGSFTCVHKDGNNHTADLAG